jgi:uncharacterized membrane protein YfcA
MHWLWLAAIGLAGGLASGVFGIGGGVVIVPALVYGLGFTQQRATGTSLAVLLPPIGLAAAVEYYRHGNVDLGAALVIAPAMFLGGWLGAWTANRVGEGWLKLAFGLFLCTLGLYLISGSVRALLRGV